MSAEAVLAAWIYAVPPMAVPVRVLLGLSRGLRGAVLSGVTSGDGRRTLLPREGEERYRRFCEHQEAREGLEDGVRMLSLDHPDGVTPRVHRRGPSEAWRYARLQKALHLMPNSLRYTWRTVRGVYYHGQHYEATLADWGADYRDRQAARKAYAEELAAAVVFFESPDIRNRLESR